MPGGGSESSNPMMSTTMERPLSHLRLNTNYQWEKEKVPDTEWRWSYGYGQAASAGPYSHSESGEPANQSAYAAPSSHFEPQPQIHTTRSRFYRDENA
eukprot:644242-Amphidinium_carterae.1